MSFENVFWSKTSVTLCMSYVPTNFQPTRGYVTLNNYNSWLNLMKEKNYSAGGITIMK